MKIVFLHKSLVMGGVERILINYLNLLKNESDLEIEVVLAFETEENIFRKDIPESIKVTYLVDKKHSEYRNSLYLSRKNNILNRLKYKLLNFKWKIECRNKLNSIIKEYDVIINFSNHFDPYINFKDNKPKIRWQHLSLRCLDKKELKKEISYLRRYDRIISICEDMKEEISHIESLRNKIIVLYHPINFDNVLSLANDSIPKVKGEYFIQVARLEEIKNHEVMIDIFYELVKKGIPQNLIIIGNGSCLKKLQAKIEILHLEERCFLLGEIKNPYPYMKNAKLFLHTSKREGLPTVLLESMVLNVPVVSMDCPTGPREILNDGECGVLIPLNDNKKFIDSVFGIHNNDQVISQYKNNIAKHLLKFSEENIRKQLINMLFEVSKE
ncbi:glycosyltransferase [Actinobacillus pleuropneumoniae]|uniref:glycosyltransferase n=1 Tax=Actinobacillus pleuropneumoniae TaxID=715 RepID=UPI0038514E58